MKRTSMMDELMKILPTFQTTAHPETDRPAEYIVLTLSHREPSARNPLGSFAYWVVSIYVSADSILPIDEYAYQVKNIIRDMGYELTSSEQGDYYDSMLDRYRLNVEYRIPRGGI